MGDRKTIQKRLERARQRFDRPGSEQDEKSLAEAAKFFRLDQKNTTERERLLYKLADVVFGPQGKKGRPRGSRTSWGHRLITLGGIYDKKKNENPKLSDAKIARLIKEECEEFKNDDPDQIRQRLPEAREWFSEWWNEQLMEYAEPPEDWKTSEPDYDDDYD